MNKAKQSQQSKTDMPAGPLPFSPALLASNVQALRSSSNRPAPITFDPSAALIRMPDLLALTGLQRGTVYKRLKDDPTFPKPVPLSNSTARGAPVAWVLGEVQTWVRARIAARGVAA